MLDRSRRFLLCWSGACLAVFALVALLADQAPLAWMDRWGARAESWGDAHNLVDHGFAIVEALSTPMLVLVFTAALALGLWWRGHHRAAGYALLVVGSTHVLTQLVKYVVNRERPTWQDPTGMLTSASYPSGHAAANTALAGVVCVLVMMLVRRSAVRRLSYAAAAGWVLLIWADRLVLGRHFPTDVIGGTAFAAGVAFAVLALYSPLPRGHAEARDPLPQVTPNARRLAVVLNPIKVESVGQFRSTVSAMAAESDWSPPLWHLTTVEDPGRGMARQAADDGADLVLVCGGDGTVREVCAELAGSGIPVGIIPAGTGNLLARNLEIPLYLRAAIDVALNGQDRAIDLVEVSGDELPDSHFMVMAGMGFDAALMEGVNEEVKRRVGWVAYIISGLKAMMFPAMRVEVVIDDQPATTHRARTVLIGNVGYLQAGMPLIPGAAIDDGLLDVVILHPKRLWSWLPLAARILTKTPHTDDTINRMTGRTVTVRASGAVPRQLDGDAIGAGRVLHMSCRHGRVLVRVRR